MTHPNTTDDKNNSDISNLDYDEQAQDEYEALLVSTAINDLMLSREYVVIIKLKDNDEIDSAPSSFHINKDDLSDKTKERIKDIIQKGQYKNEVGYRCSDFDSIHVQFNRISDKGLEVEEWSDGSGDDDEIKGENR